LASVRANAPPYVSRARHVFVLLVAIVLPVLGPSLCGGSGSFLGRRRYAARGSYTGS